MRACRGLLTPLAGAAVVAATLVVVGHPAGASATGAAGDGASRGLVPGRPDVTEVRTPGSGLVASITTPPGRPLARPAWVDKDAPPATAARAFVTAHAAGFGITDPATQLTTTQTMPAPGGGHVVRLQEHVGGYPVLGGMLAVALTGDNRVSFVNAETIPTKRVLPRPVVSATAARAAARTVTVKELRARDGRGLRAGQASLAVYDPALAGVSTTASTGLVYRVEVRGNLHGARPVDQLVLIDAVTGAVVLHADQVRYDAEQTVCTAADNPAVNDYTCPPVNASGPTPVSDPAAGSDTDAKDAYYYAQATYDFYRQVVGDATEVGVAGSAAGNRALVSTVHLCDPDESTVSSCAPMINAFWDGTQMVYGDGFAAADDVVAHELTHGVTEHASNLFYWYQPGAINESMSDVLGELADQWDANDPVLSGGAAPGPGADTDATRWRLGEDLPVGALRDMSDPTLQHLSYQPSQYAVAQPDSMTSGFYDASQDIDQGGQAFPSDNGGVHTNSGVGNKAAYLIVDGSANDPTTAGTASAGTFNGVRVPGLSGADLVERITKAAKIYYLADQSLTSGSDYADLARVLPAACDSLVGTAGITTGDCATVRAAVKATAMDHQPVRGTAPEAPSCGTTATSTDWYDNLERPGAGLWTRSPQSGRYGPFYYPQNNNPYDVSLVYATSGSQEIWGDDPDPQQSGLPRDGAIAMTHAVAVPVGKPMYLRFNHAYQFEWYPAQGGYPALYTDGGRVEYSANGGAWQSAAALFDTNGYNHTLNGLDASGQNLIYSVKGFGGDSHGYLSSRLNLSPLAGKSVRFRFRVTADDAVGAVGWFIDDIRFYTCGSRPAAPHPVTQRPGIGQVTVAWQPPADTGTSKIGSYRVSLKSGNTTLATKVVTAATRTTTLSGLPNGRNLTAVVTATNAAGAGPAGTSSTLLGTKLSVTSRLSSGHRILTGKLTTANGAGLARRIVTLWRAPLAGNTWTLVSRTETVTGGAYRFTPVKSRKQRFRVQFAGTAPYQGTRSTIVRFR